MFGYDIMEQKNKVFCFGLDNAGKTTLLTTMQNRDVNENTAPTKIFDIFDMIIEESKFVIWDAPGQVKYRKSWEKSLLKTDILLFLIDMADRIRFQEASLELNAIIRKEDVENIPLVICFHKFDLKESKDNFAEASRIFQLSQGYLLVENFSFSKQNN